MEQPALKPTRDVEEILTRIQSSDIEYAKKVDSSVLTAENIFFVTSVAKSECGSFEFLQYIFNRPSNRENERRALQLALRLEKHPIAWMMLQTWDNVEFLDLAGCKLDTFPSIPIKVCQSLKEIDISGNYFEILPIKISSYPNLKYVNIEGNPLTAYPEKYRTSWSKLKEYLISLEKRAMLEKIQKLVVVGQECVGKSTLLRCLQKKTNRTNCATNLSTDGIDVTDFTFHFDNPNNNSNNQDVESNSILCRAWDFGGQEIYYQSHQFFLTSQSTYILCFDLTQPDVPRMSYWLQQIQSLSRIWKKYEQLNEDVASDTAIFIVGTHADDKICTPEHINNTLDGLKMIISKYKIQSFLKSFAVSCKTGKGITELKEALYLHFLDISTKKGVIPTSWVALGDYLMREKEERVAYIEWKSFESIAAKFKLSGSVLRSCTRYLMSIGSILHFPFKEHVDDMEMVVIDPKWLSDLMICFFTTQSTYVKKGILAITDIPNIFKNYRPYMHMPLMNLLERFSIIFLMKSGDYLIPSLLPMQIQYSDILAHWNDQADQVKLEQKRIYKFEFLPLGFFARVIVHLLYLNLVTCKLFWKAGAILSTPVQDAFITFDEKEFLLVIRIKSSPNSSVKSDHLLRLVVETTETLLECYYPNLVQNCKRLVPCNHCKSDQPFMFTYEDCMKAALDEKPYLFCNNIISLSRCVSVSLLAPDIGFADIPQIDNLEIDENCVLGEGSFGVVNKGVWCGQEVAIKTIKTSSEAEELPKFREFQQETFIMSNIDHPSLVKLYGVTRYPLRMVMEYIKEGDLFNLMHPLLPDSRHDRGQADITSFSLKLRLKIALDVAKGMQYLQSLSPPIIHRDLRSPNIFIVSLSENSEVSAKVADFGLARIVTKSMKGALNSWQWLAPEVISTLDVERDRIEYGLASDVYSFGIILWELLTFQIPFEEYLGDPKYTKSFKDGTGREVQMLNPNIVKNAIIKENLRPTLPDNLNCSHDVRSMIEQAWNSDPKRRPNFHDIVFILSLELNIDSQPKRAIISSRNVLQHSVRSIFYSPLNLQQRMEEDPSKVFDFVSTLEPLENVQTPDRFATAFVYTFNSALWVGFSDGSITIFHSKNFREVKTIWPADKNRITCIIYQQNHIWASSVSGIIKIWDVDSLLFLKSLSHKDKKPVKYMIKTEVSVNNEFKSFVWSISPKGKAIYIWDTKTLETVNIINFTHQITAITNVGQKTVWVGLETGDIICHNAETLNTIGNWRAHQSTVTFFLLVDHNTVWSATDNGEIKVWVVKDGTRIYNVTEMRAHTNTIVSLVRVGNHVCSISVDHSLILWDIQTMNGVQEIILSQTQSPISLFSLNHHLWCALSDATIVVYDYKFSGDPVEEFSFDVHISKCIEQSEQLTIDNSPSLSILEIQNKLANQSLGSAEQPTKQRSSSVVGPLIESFEKEKQLFVSVLTKPRPSSAKAGVSQKSDEQTTPETPRKRKGSISFFKRKTKNVNS